MTDSTNDNNDNDQERQIYVVGIYSKPLKIGQDDIRSPGEEIPEAHDFKPTVLQAHLNMKFIQTKEEYTMQKKHDNELEKARIEKKERKDKKRLEAQERRDATYKANKEKDLRLNGVFPDKESGSAESNNDQNESDSDESALNESDTNESNDIQNESDSGQIANTEDKKPNNLDSIDSIVTLRQIAESYKLSKGGGKDAIRDRIREHEKTLS